MTCGSPACGTGGGYKDFAPLEPGEKIVNTFAAPSGTPGETYPDPAARGILLQVSAQGNKSLQMMSLSVSKVVEIPGSGGKVELVHDSTIKVPMSN